MPSTYTPDPTSTQAPASAPDPDDFPLESLPNSGEGCTAASIAQGFKVLGDYVAWLKKPRAASAVWLQAIRSYRNALLQRRFGIDHLGFPAGKIVAWQELFDDVALVTKNAIGNGNWAGRWAYSIAGPNAGTVAGGGALNLSCSGSGITPNSVHIEKAFPPNPVPFADSTMAMQWDSAWTDVSNTVTEYDLGFYVGTTMLGVATAFSAGTQPGACFVKRGGDANWFAYTRAFGAGAATYTPTGVARADGKRFRIELIGANGSDNTTARAIFYIDGASVANVAVDMAYDSLLPFFRATSTQASSSLRVLNLDYRSNLWPGDIFI